MGFREALDVGPVDLVAQRRKRSDEPVVSGRCSPVPEGSVASGLCSSVAYLSICSNPQVATAQRLCDQLFEDGLLGRARTDGVSSDGVEPQDRADTVIPPNQDRHGRQRVFDDRLLGTQVALRALDTEFRQ